MGELLHISDVVLSYISGDWGEEVNTDGSLVEVACVRGADINNLKAGIFDQLPIRYIKESSLRKNGLQVGNIIIEKSGGSPTQSTGRVAYVSRESLENRENIVCSNFCAAFSIKPEWDSQYIFYYLQYFYNTGVFFNFEGKTSGLHNLQIEQAFKAIPIKKIPLPEQKRIASVLSALDKKIALNRQINQNLEALARQLYDYWFVQFDFPDANGKPYKSSGGKMVYNPILKREIPEGWHCGNLYEIAKFTNGLACQKYRPESNEESLRVIKIREMHEGFSKDTEYVTSNIPEAVKVYNGDVLFSWSASLEVMLWAKGEGGLNQHIFKVTSANNYPKSFYYYQLLNYVSLFKQMAEARKTTMGHITQDHLEQSRIAIPDSKGITYQLEGKLAPIFDAIVNNESEIASLTKQRDELLPLLMNGQVNFDLSAY